MCFAKTFNIIKFLDIVLKDYSLGPEKGTNIYMSRMLPDLGPHLCAACFKWLLFSLWKATENKSGSQELPNAVLK